MTLLRCCKLCATAAEDSFTLLSCSCIDFVCTSSLFLSLRHDLVMSSRSPETFLTISPVSSCDLAKVSSKDSIFFCASCMKFMISVRNFADWLSSSWYEPLTSFNISALCAATVWVAVWKWAFTLEIIVFTVSRRPWIWLLASCFRLFTSSWTASSCGTLALSWRIALSSVLCTLTSSLVCARSCVTLASPVSSPHKSSLRRLCRASSETSFTSKSVVLVFSSFPCCSVRVST
mmetsp:Transcript_33820/g.97193  ORF Transcript_33820/g.97193 Transcript_33820/m.97193 type:complete len:233 (+) Transcript_33820:591-1289(+)